MIRRFQFVVLALMFGLQVAAQNQKPQSTGNLGGFVIDEKGSPVMDVKITLKHKKSFIKITSDAKGEFLFASLEPAFYSVEFEKKGFKTDLIGAIEVRADKTSRVKLSLQPGSGSLKEQKEDPCFISGDVTKDTMQSSVANEIDECTFRSLPVRNLSDLF